MIKNPVMFVVEVGAALTTVLLVRDVVARRAAASASSCRSRSGCGPRCCSPTSPRRWPRGAARRRPTRCARRAPRRSPTGSTPTGRPRPCRPRRCARTTSCWSRPASSSRPTARSSRAWRRWTSRPSPASRRRSSARPAAIARRSPAARACCRTGSRSRVTADPGQTFLDRMIALVEGAERQKTPNEIALNILLAGLTIVFLMAVVTLQPFAIYSGAPQSVFVLVSLLVCLIPTTIGGLLSAIGIAGMDRLIQHNVLAMSGRAVEAAGDVHTLLLDKTGTITLGNRQASGVHAAAPASPRRRWPTRRSWRRSPTRRRKAGRSSCWPSRSTASAAATWRRTPRRSCRSPRRRACRASTSTAARSARAPPTRSRSTSTRNGGTMPAGARRDRRAHRARRRHAAGRRRARRARSA